MLLLSARNLGALLFSGRVCKESCYGGLGRALVSCKVLQPWFGDAARSGIPSKLKAPVAACSAPFLPMQNDEQHLWVKALCSCPHVHFPSLPALSFLPLDGALHALQLPAGRLEACTAWQHASSCLFFLLPPSCYC